MQFIFSAHQSWLQDQPAFANWQAGTTHVGGEMEALIRNYSAQLCEKIVTPQNPLYLAYFTRMWCCLSYYWQAAASHGSEQNSPVDVQKIFACLTQGTDPMTGKDLGGNPLRDVVLAEALVQRDAKAQNIFEAEYKQRILSTIKEYRPNLDCEDVYTDFVDALCGFQPGQKQVLQGQSQDLEAESLAIDNDSSANVAAEPTLETREQELERERQQTVAMRTNALTGEDGLVYWTEQLAKLAGCPDDDPDHSSRNKLQQEMVAWTESRLGKNITAGWKEVATLLAGYAPRKAILSAYRGEACLIGFCSGVSLRRFVIGREKQVRQGKSVSPEILESVLSVGPTMEVDDPIPEACDTLIQGMFATALDYLFAIIPLSTTGNEERERRRELKMAEAWQTLEQSLSNEQVQNLNYKSEAGKQKVRNAAFAFINHHEMSASDLSKIMGVNQGQITRYLQLAGDIFNRFLRVIQDRTTGKAKRCLDSFDDRDLAQATLSAMTSLALDDPRREAGSDE